MTHTVLSWKMMRHILLRSSHFRSREHCQHKTLTSTSWTDHRPFPFTIRYVLNGCIVWPFMNIHVFAKLGKMFAFTKWKNYGGGLDEMDIMNIAEVIIDNSCFLSFVCLTYNLTITWQTESKVRLVSHVYYRQWRACNLFWKITVGELSKVNETWGLQWKS